MISSLFFVNMNISLLHLSSLIHRSKTSTEHFSLLYDAQCIVLLLFCMENQEIARHKYNLNQIMLLLYDLLSRAIWRMALLSPESWSGLKNISDNMASKSQLASLSVILLIKNSFGVLFIIFCLLEYEWWEGIIGLYNGLALNRWQVITLTNYNNVQWRIYMSIGEDELHWFLHKFSSIHFHFRGIFQNFVMIMTILFQLC